MVHYLPRKERERYSAVSPKLERQCRRCYAACLGGARSTARYALLRRRIHPLACDVQKPIPKFLISGQSRESHAFACVVHAFLFCSHGRSLPSHGGLRVEADAVKCFKTRTKFRGLCSTGSSRSGRTRVTARGVPRNPAPHLVELALLPGGFRRVFLDFDALHRERRIPVRRGQSRQEREQRRRRRLGRIERR